MLAESKRDITNLICNSRPHGDRHLQHAKKSGTGFSSHAQCNPSPCSLLQYTFPPSLLFLLFLPPLWAVTLLAVSGVVCCCAHITDGDRAHIYFVIEILNQDLNFSTLYLLKASAAANPSPPFPAAPGKVSLLFIFLLYTGWTTVNFYVQRFTLRLSSDSDSLFFPLIPGKKKNKEKKKRLLAWMTLRLENSSASGLSMRGGTVRAPHSPLLPFLPSLTWWLETPILGSRSKEGPESPVRILAYTGEQGERLMHTPRSRGSAITQIA